MTEQIHRQQYPKQGFKADETPAGGRPRRKPETLEAVLAENKELRAENKELRTENRKIRSESNKRYASLEAAKKKNERLLKRIKSADKSEEAAKERIKKLRDWCKSLAREVSDLKMQYGLDMKQLHLTYAEMMNSDENGICDEVLNIQQENKRLKDEKSRLEARDRYDDGPHTPGSKKTLTQKSADAEKRKKKKQKKKAGGKSARRPGGQRGHKGYAHKYGKAEETRHITMNRCNKKDYRCKKLKETRVETVYAEEITKPQRRTVKCIVTYYDCLGCGNTNMRSDDPHPKKRQIRAQRGHGGAPKLPVPHAKQVERRQTSSVGRTLDGIWYGRKHPQEGWATDSCHLQTC